MVKNNNNQDKIKYDKCLDVTLWISLYFIHFSYASCSKQVTLQVSTHSLQATQNPKDQVGYHSLLPLIYSVCGHHIFLKFENGRNLSVFVLSHKGPYTCCILNHLDIAMYISWALCASSCANFSGAQSQVAPDVAKWL